MSTFHNPFLPKNRLIFFTFSKKLQKSIIEHDEDNILEKLNKIERWNRANVFGLPFGYDSLFIQRQQTYLNYPLSPKTKAQELPVLKQEEPHIPLF